MALKNLRSMFAVFSLCWVGIMHAQAASTTDLLLRQKNDPVLGNPAGNVTVVEFFDYQCSYCERMVPTVIALLNSNRNIRLVLKEYPIRGPESELAARAALAANMQGKYQAFSKALFSQTDLTEKSMVRLAKTLGLNPEKLLKDMTSSTVTMVLQTNYQLGETLKVEGTPTYFVAKTNATDVRQSVAIFGATSKAELEAAIRKIG